MTRRVYAAGVIPVSTRTGRVLLGLRSSEVDHELTWGCFGGAIGRSEDGRRETPQEAAIRELQEETSYHGEIRLSDALVFRDRSIEYSNFFGFILNEYDPKLNWEHDDAQWFEYEDIPLTLHPGVKWLLREKGSELSRYIDFMRNKG